MSWWNEVLMVVVGLAVLFAVWTFVGIRKNQRATRGAVGRLSAAAVPVAWSDSELDSFADLPEPVARYFERVFVRPLPAMATERFFQKGQLKINPKARCWSPFTAVYTVAENPPGFVWDARVALAPLLYVRVRDAFTDGVGSGEVRLLSAFPLGQDRDRPELNSGALYRYLAEAVWHPRALLPQCGVKWQALDDDRAVATLEVYGISVSLEFRFSEAGEIVGVYTEDRYGRFDGKYIKYPWEGRFSDYHEVNGIRIPLRGEVGWHLPDGWWLFWKGEIVTEVTGVRANPSAV